MVTQAEEINVVRARVREGKLLEMRRFIQWYIAKTHNP